MSKLRKAGASFVVSIPKSKIIKKGWKIGQELDWADYPNGDLVLTEAAKEE